MSSIFALAVQLLQVLGVYDNLIRFILVSFSIMVVFAALNYFRK